MIVKLSTMSGQFVIYVEIWIQSSLTSSILADYPQVFQFPHISGPSMYFQELNKITEIVAVNHYVIESFAAESMTSADR